jgi:hypothetical protein
MGRFLTGLMVAVSALAAQVNADAPPSQRQRDEAELTRIKTEVWPGFYRRQDAAGLASFLAPTFVNIAPDGSVTERASEIAWVRENSWNPKNFRYTVKRFAWINDDLVVVIGRGESDRADDAGKPCRHSYTSSNLLRRAAGAPHGWQALSSHVSGDQCVAP